MSKRRLSSRLRIQFLGLFMLLGVGSLGVRLWWIQVAHGQEWTSQIRGSSQATVRIPSVRGEIKDRNGITLVQNRASYEVDFYLPEMVKGYRERFGSPPSSEYRAIISGMPKDMKEPDIIKIVNNGIVPRLNELDLARDYNAGKLQRHFRNNTEVPFSYIKDIDFPTMAKFAEHDVGLPGVDLAIKPVRSYVYGALAAHLLGYVGAPDDVNKEEARKYTFYQGDVDGKSNIDFPTMAKFAEHDVGLPGVDLAIKPVRSYVYGALAAHLLGYVGPPDDTNKEEAKKFTFYQSDVEGKSNVEKAMDEYLKGKPGIRYMRRNAKGQIDGVLREVPPTAGANVNLTIDARIQMIADEALRAVGRAAAVVVDPNNGNILAMASVPSFDPNTFIPSIKAKDWDALRKDEATPMVNRAVSAFPPGSTFKLVTTLAGLRKGLANKTFNCGGGVTVESFV